MLGGSAVEKENSPAPFDNEDAVVIAGGLLHVERLVELYGTKNSLNAKVTNGAGGE